MITVSTYNISFSESATDDPPMIEEFDVDATRVVAVMREALAGSSGYKLIYADHGADSFTGEEDEAKSWRVANLHGTFDLVVSRVTRATSLAVLKAEERAAWSRVVQAKDAGGSASNAHRRAVEEHQRAVATLERAEREALGAKAYNPAHVAALASAAYTQAERIFECTVYGD